MGGDRKPPYHNFYAARLRHPIEKYNTLCDTLPPDFCLSARFDRARSGRNAGAHAHTTATGGASTAQYNMCTIQKPRVINIIHCGPRAPPTHDPVAEGTAGRGVYSVSQKSPYITPVTDLTEVHDGVLYIVYRRGHKTEKGLKTRKSDVLSIDFPAICKEIE